MLADGQRPLVFVAGDLSGPTEPAVRQVFEAAVAGGIPVIKGLREGAAAQPEREDEENGGFWSR